MASSPRRTRCRWGVASRWWIGFPRGSRTRRCAAPGERHLCRGRSAPAWDSHPVRGSISRVDPCPPAGGSGSGLVARLRGGPTPVWGLRLPQEAQAPGGSLGPQKGPRLRVGTSSLPKERLAPVESPLANEARLRVERPCSRGSSWSRGRPHLREGGDAVTDGTSQSSEEDALFRFPESRLREEVRLQCGTHSAEARPAPRLRSRRSIVPVGVTPHEAASLRGGTSLPRKIRPRFGSVKTLRLPGCNSATTQASLDSPPCTGGPSPMRYRVRVNRDPLGDPPLLAGSA